MPEALTHYLSNFKRHYLRPESFFVFLLYFLVAEGSLYVYLHFHTSPALIWPPIGIGLGAVILWGNRMWLPIFLAQFLAVLSMSQTRVSVIFLIALAYTVQAVVGGMLLHRLRFESSLDKSRNVLLFVFVASIVTVITPTISTLAQMNFHTLALSPLLNWLRGWGAGIFSVLVVTPFMLTWYPFRNIRYSRREVLEIVSAFALLSFNNYFLFWTNYPQYFGIVIIFFLPAILIWFALRLNVRWFTLAMLVTSVQGIAGSIAHHSALVPLSAQLISDQVYIGVIAGIFLEFVAVVEERRAAFKKLERAFRSSSAADTAKTEFIAILAHELRNPLAPIVTSLELLKLQPQTEEALDTIESAQEHAKMIRRLLDDLLDTVRLTQKKFKLQKETVSLRRLIDQSVASVNEVVLSRGHQLQIALPKEEVELYVDPIRVKQIIINLLTNAAKYTNRGGTITLVCDQRKNVLFIRISDTGIGISRDVLPSIFEPFKQGESANTRGSGLGIGLYISQRLAEMHDGRLEVQSDGLGRGSTFTLALPLPEKIDWPEKKKEVAPMKVGEHRILIVDDNEPVANGLQKLLAHRNHTVEIAYSGADALRVMHTFDPEIILLDIGMPDMNGYDVAKEIRRLGWKGMLVALTGFGQDSDRQRAQKAGFDHHLTKPVGIEDIVLVLQRIPTATEGEVQR